MIHISEQKYQEMGYCASVRPRLKFWILEVDRALELWSAARAVQSVRFVRRLYDDDDIGDGQASEPGI